MAVTNVQATVTELTQITGYGETITGYTFELKASTDSITIPAGAYALAEITGTVDPVAGEDSTITITQVVDTTSAVTIATTGGYTLTGIYYPTEAVNGVTATARLWVAPDA